jgi:hypothetical protein
VSIGSCELLCSSGGIDTGIERIQLEEMYLFLKENVLSLSLLSPPLSPSLLVHSFSAATAAAPSPLCR